MNIQEIKTEQGYKNALTKLEGIFDAPVNSKEGEELNFLGKMIDDYEKIHHPVKIRLINYNKNN